VTSKNNKTLDVTIPQPKRLSVGSTDDGLIEIEIQLRKYKLFVVETNGFTRFKRGSFVNELMKELGDPKGYDNIVKWNMLTQVWAPLFVSSHGDVPDKEQFLSLPAVDLEFWVDTAKELGHEFLWLDELNKGIQSDLEQAEADKEDVKKKSRQPDDHPETEEIPTGRPV